ncbi:MAG TPA: ribose 1,5-bisphosphate isomerase [Armatimonadetes bacterium]|nr:ribose 1,5-bisphosphate isomerase [Armatimonadota bacterium]
MSFEKDSFKWDELTVTRGIVETFMADFLDSIDLDVAVVGAGPSGITAARILAGQGHRVGIFERNLHIGGGIWGGGMLFPRIVIEEEAAPLMEAAGVKLRPWKDGTVIADAVESATKMTAAAIDAGARIFVGIEAEDVVVDDSDRVCGVVINWGAVTAAKLHVDPLAVHSKVLIESTGHPCEVGDVLLRKIPGARLDTGETCVPGEASMNARAGEAALIANTREIYPGVVVAGMAANAVSRSPRMGAIFGGMLLSGQKAAEISAQIIADLG